MWWRAGFTVRNWGHQGEAEVSLDGKTPEHMRQGIAYDVAGREYLVVWIEMRADKPVEFSVGGAKPAARYKLPRYLSRPALD